MGDAFWHPYGHTETTMKSLRVALYALLAVLCISTVVLAQDTGQITGTVLDSTGAAFPGAQVTITNHSAGITRNTVTNSSGEYLVAGLPQGKYDVSVTGKGFKEYLATAVVLDAAQKLRVDVTLQVGTISEKVIVSGENVAQVETQSAELATTITSTQISELELNGRNFSQLVTLTPGVGNSGTRGEAGVGVNGSILYNVNGGRNEYNNWELDGGSVMDSGSNQSLNLYPSLDSISEVRVMTSNYGAQYGLNGSGTIEVETKAGTNQFHGDLYEYVRNDDFNANGFFNNAAGNPRPPYKRNDFGYTLGGPVYIPGHYNTHKDKTFFFWSQEWRRNRNPYTIAQGVPSDAERGGDFSDICSPNVPYAVPSSSGGLVNPYLDFCPTILPSGVSYSTVPVDPNGAALLASVPHATETGTAAVNDASCGFVPACYKASLSVPENWREQQLRIDHNLTSKERVFVRYTHDGWKVTNPGTGGFVSSSTFPTLPNLESGPGTSAVVHVTSTFSSTLVNEFVASYNVDHIYFSLLPFNGTNYWQLPSTFTMPGLFPNQSPLFGGKIPGFSVGSADQTGGGENDPYGGGFRQDDGAAPWENSSPVYGLKDTVTKIVGKHNLAFGATYLAYEKNEPGVPDIQGFLSFSNGDFNISSGNAIADLLMGNIANYSQTSSQPKYYNRYKIAEPFFQDDWRITNRLTLNLGFRLSLFGTYRDISLKSYNWEAPAFQSGAAPLIDYDGSATGQVDALIPGVGNPFNGLVQCGGPGGPFGPADQNGATGGSKYPGCMKGHLFNPGPRLGFAWDPWGKGKTSIRGGYGIFFEHQNGDEANSESLESTPPIACTPTQFNIQAPGYPPNPNPGLGYAGVGGGGSGLNACNGVGLLFTSGITAIPITAVWPYVQQWNLDVEHEILPATVLTVAYVGSKGTHLNLQNDVNQIVPTPASQDPYPKGQAISVNDCNTVNVNWNDSTNSLSGVTATIMGPGGSQNIPVSGQAAINLAVACGVTNTNDIFRPYQGWGDIVYLENVANSNYNALQVSLRRNTGPLVLSVAYTYSHSLDDSSDRYDGSFVNAYDLHANYGSSGFDQRHLLNISYVYNLPFFKNGGLEHKLLGGWELSGIVSWQSGTPFSVVPNVFGDNAGVSNGIGSGSYVDLVPGQNPHAVPSGTTGLGPLLFNPAAFALPTGLTFGNEGRDAFAGPSFSNFDMALFKKFSVTETSHFEFRAEAFNVFNQTEFTGVNATINTANFLRPGGNQPARLLELALKFIF
jgi:hypothetical protein